MSDLKLLKILNAEIFYKDVESLVNKHNLSYMDAVIYYCEKNDIEIEAAGAMVKSNFRFKSHIQQEGETLRYLPKTAKLPI
jgi:hypothetical protein